MFRFCRRSALTLAQKAVSSVLDTVLSLSVSPGQRRADPFLGGGRLGLGRRVGLRLQRDHPLGEFGLVQLAVTVLVIGRNCVSTTCAIWLPVAWTWPLPERLQSTLLVAQSAPGRRGCGRRLRRRRVVWAGAGVPVQERGQTPSSRAKKSIFHHLVSPYLVRSMTMKTRNASSSLVIRSRSAFCHMGIASFGFEGSARPC